MHNYIFIYDCLFYIMYIWIIVGGRVLTTYFMKTPLLFPIWIFQIFSNVSFILTEKQTALPLKSESPFQEISPRKKLRKIGNAINNCFSLITHKATLEKDGRNATKA